MASTDTVKSIISQAIINVGEIETVYELHDYDDLVTHQRPKLTISVNSLIQLRNPFCKMLILLQQAMMINCTKHASRWKNC